MRDKDGAESAAAPSRRRRGKELEEALLSAAWSELQEHGYAGLTFEGVAARAGTSRPVVHRRWRSKPELVHATLVHLGRSHTPVNPDTGTLRGDVLALMADIVERRTELTALLTTHLGAYFEETGSSLADLRTEVLAGRTSHLEGVFDRAAARGEIDRDALTPRIASLPFDLLRHDLLMTLRPVSDETLVEIVDTVFLPLVLER